MYLQLLWCTGQITNLNVFRTPSEERWGDHHENSGLSSRKTGQHNKLVPDQQMNLIEKRRQTKEMTGSHKQDNKRKERVSNSVNSDAYAFL